MGIDEESVEEKKGGLAKVVEERCIFLACHIPFNWILNDDGVDCDYQTNVSWDKRLDRLLGYNNALVTGSQVIYLIFMRQLFSIKKSCAHLEVAAGTYFIVQ